MKMGRSGLKITLRTARRMGEVYFGFLTVRRGMKEYIRMA